MAFPPGNPLLLFQLSLLLVIPLTAHCQQDATVALTAAPLSHSPPPSTAPTPHHHRHHHHQAPAPSHYHAKAPYGAHAPSPGHHQAPAPSRRHHLHSHPPAPAPMLQTHPPVAAPNSHAPRPPPHLPVRSLVALEGYVSCKTCNGNTTSKVPLKGALVKASCSNTKMGLVLNAVTDKNGHFSLEGRNGLTSYGVHKCGVYLVSSPDHLCNVTLSKSGVLPTFRQNVKNAKPPLAIYHVRDLFFTTNSTASRCYKF